MTGHDMTLHDMTYIATLTYTDTYLDLFENTSKKHQKTLKILAGVDPKGWPSGHVSGAVQVLKNWFGPYGHLQGTTGLTKVFPSQIWSFKHDSQGKFLWIFWTNLGQIWWFAKILSGEHFQKEMHFLRPSPGNYDSIHFNTIPGWSLSLSEAPIHFFIFEWTPKCGQLPRPPMPLWVWYSKGLLTGWWRPTIWLACSGRRFGSWVDMSWDWLPIAIECYWIIGRP